MADGEADAGTPLFAIFVISLLSLFLVPFTIYKLCAAASTSDRVVKPWEAAGDRRKGALGRFFARLASPSAIALLLGWLLLFALLAYVRTSAKDLAPFDPYDILKLERSASEQDVKKAYRRLSLQWHPDKNPDPAAVPVFLAISQAYRALTDETARKNWEQFGHPDGKQAMDIGIALPKWLMADDGNAPAVLAALVIVGIVLPLGAAAWFLFSSSKYMGPNQIMGETLDIFIRSKFAVKEGQSLARIPDTLVMAMEFILLPTPSEQAAGLEELRKEVLRAHPELKEKPQFFKRKASIVKVHMLLLAHTGRLPIPASLAKDRDFFLRKSVLLLEEMVKIANIPRFSPAGWLTPSVGAVEMLQCLTQAVPPASRRTFSTGKAGDGGAPLLQLPHMGAEAVKKLARRKVRGLPELLELPTEERLEALESAGLSSGQAREAATALLSMPVVTVAAADCGVEGEAPGADILEEDVITCSVRLLLSRPAHSQPDATAPRGAAVAAFAPHCPAPRHERWFVFLADAAHNATLSWTVVSLLEAEAAGLAAVKRLAATRAERAAAEGAAAAAAAEGEAGAQPAQPAAAANGSAAAAPAQQQQEGQAVELRFRAPRQGKYDLTLFVVSDCWVGCDRAVPVRLRVHELTRAEREGRTQRGRPAGTAAGAAAAEEQPEAGAGGSGGESESGGSESESDEYDSEEGSTEESGSEASDGEGADKAGSDASSTEAEAPLLRDIE